MIVCSCAVVNDTICKDMLKDMSVNDFCKISGAGYNCGSCIPTLIQIKQGVEYAKITSKENDIVRESQKEKEITQTITRRTAKTTLCTTP